MDRPVLGHSDSGGSASSDDFAVSLNRPGHDERFEEDGDDDTDDTLQFTPGSTVSNITPMGKSASNQPSWSSQAQSKTKDDNPRTALNGMASPRPQRPSAPARTPSSTYNPPRKPSHFISLHPNRQRSYSSSRRRDPNAQYRAQEKAYIQQLRQDHNNDYYDELYTPSLAYSTDSEPDEESPSSEVHFDNDAYDQDTQLFYNNDDLQPSLEELQVPENRERLEWHSMLASVLKGDVVKQEKQRLIGTTDQKGEKALSNEIWIGVRAKVCGRSIAAQKRIVEEGRAS